MNLEKIEKVLLRFLGQVDKIHCEVCILNHFFTKILYCRLGKWLQRMSKQGEITWSNTQLLKVGLWYSRDVTLEITRLKFSHLITKSWHLTLESSKFAVPLAAGHSTCSVDKIKWMKLIKELSSLLMVLKCVLFCCCFFLPFSCSLFTVHSAWVCSALCNSHVGSSSRFQARRSRDSCTVQRVRLTNHYNYIDFMQMMFIHKLLLMLLASVKREWKSRSSQNNISCWQLIQSPRANENLAV